MCVPSLPWPCGGLHSTPVAQQARRRFVHWMLPRAPTVMSDGCPYPHLGPNVCMCRLSIKLPISARSIRSARRRAGPGLGPELASDPATANVQPEHQHQETAEQLMSAPAGPRTRQVAAAVTPDRASPWRRRHVGSLRCWRQRHSHPGFRTRRRWQSSAHGCVP